MNSILISLAKKKTTPLSHTSNLPKIGTPPPPSYKNSYHFSSTTILSLEPLSSKIDEQEATESGEGDDEEVESDGESEEEETREQEEESFDLIPRTPEDDEDDGNGEEDQSLRISVEERMHEEEEADELYRDVDINQGRGLQVSQDIEDSHMTLTPTHFDGQQESSSTSSFVTNLLNLIIDPGIESIFTTGSSTVTPIPSPKSTMTPSIMTTTTTASQPQIPPTPIPSINL
nr:hypothetical protein [Tanacetum cinerariifolium]